MSDQGRSHVTLYQYRGIDTLKVNLMLVLVVMVALVAASIVYVYRFRGEARYESLTEYFRKGWPIFSPLNCALYMTTLPRGSKAALDPADFPELDLLRQNWQTIRDEGMELLRQNYFDATKRPGTAGYYDVGSRIILQVWLELLLHQMVRVHASFRQTPVSQDGRDTA